MFQRESEGAGIGWQTWADPDKREFTESGKWGQLMGSGRLGLLAGVHLEEKQISVSLWQEVVVEEGKLFCYRDQELELPSW